MTLTEIDPKNIYKWFMEMYVDSSEWVMVPNVLEWEHLQMAGFFNKTLCLWFKLFIKNE